MRTENASTIRNCLAGNAPGAQSAASGQPRPPPFLLYMGSTPRPQKSVVDRRVAQPGAENDRAGEATDDPAIGRVEMRMFLFPNAIACWVCRAFAGLRPRRN